MQLLLLRNPVRRILCSQICDILVVPNPKLLGDTWRKRLLLGEQSCMAAKGL